MMKPRGPLMIEHRLIERMLELIKKEMRWIAEKKEARPLFIDTAADFIRTYADKTHHGKEEDILFRELAKKQLHPEDQQIMKELIEEHKYGRKITGELIEAKRRYVNDDTDSLSIIFEKLDALVKFYPEHISKEDKVFFPSSEKYLSQTEQEKMLQEFRDFDQKMIHEKYKSLVLQMEGDQ
jgi:hemerythrin-like domain-containing protein